MTFQRLIDSLLGPELEPHVFGYFDDIIVAMETFEEHLKWVRIVLNKLVDVRLKVNREKCEEAFEELKHALTTTPVLARPDFSKPFYVQCDASSSALGSVLVQ